MESVKRGEMVKILFLGDIVGEPGRKAVIESLPELKQELQFDFVIVNGENAAGGRGITGRLAIELLRAGVSVITTGDHVWDQKDLQHYIDTEPRLLRPVNYPEETPGAGHVVLETAKGKVGVINVQGRTFMQPILDDPFAAMEIAVDKVREETAVIFVDVHAETTSEKQALGRFLDGQVSAVVGTHTHVQTADQQIFPGGTAYLTDAGMCGPHDSILGRQTASILYRFTKAMPTPFPVAKNQVRLNGVVVVVDPRTGKAESIQRLSRPFRDNADS